jgi:hypothetical protein
MTAASDPRAIGRGPADEAQPAVDPARPVAIELAAAVLLAGGVFRLLAIGLALAGPEGAVVSPVVAAAETSLQVITIVIALLIRTGRAWIVAINVTAVLAFLEVLGLPSPVSLGFAFLFGLAFVAVFLHKPWFDAKRAWRAIRPEVRA